MSKLYIMHCPNIVSKVKFEIVDVASKTSFNIDNRFVEFETPSIMNFSHNVPYATLAILTGIDELEPRTMYVIDVTNCDNIDSE